MFCICLFTCRYGAPPFAYLEVSFSSLSSSSSSSSSSPIDVSFDLSWFGKPPTRLAESLWLTVSPAGHPRTGWQMHKLGRWVDPLNVPVNGSVTRHAVWTGVSFFLFLSLIYYFVALSRMFVPQLHPHRVHPQLQAVRWCVRVPTVMHRTLCC
jgi:hypothetical protein